MSLVKIKVMKFSSQSILFVWFLIGMYLNLSLFISEGLFIPNFIAYFSGGLLVMIHIKKFLYRKYITFIVGILIVSILSIIFSPKLVPGVLKEQMLSFAQLVLSLVTCFGVLFTLEHLGSRKVSRIFFVFAFILVSGSFLERFSPLVKDLSDAFRNLIYKFGVYSSDIRDLNMSGYVRPKFFSREPSFLSQFLFLSIFIWSIISSFRYKISLTLFIVTISIIIIGSPKMLIIFPLLFVFNIKIIQKYLFKYDFIFLICIFLILISLTFFVNNIFNFRINEFISGSDQSFNMRITIPLVVLFSSIVKYPFFSVGLGGKETSLEIFNNTLSSFGYDWMVRSGFEPNFHSFSLETVHFFGLLGTLLIVFLFNRYLLKGFFKYQFFIYWFSLLLISLMGGFFVGVKSWFVVVVLYYAISNHKKYV